jgi:hypothetical protein
LKKGPLKSLTGGTDLEKNVFLFTLGVGFKSKSVHKINIVSNGEREGHQFGSTSCQDIIMLWLLIQDGGL